MTPGRFLNIKVLRSQNRRAQGARPGEWVGVPGCFCTKSFASTEDPTSLTPWPTPLPLRRLGHFSPASRSLNPTHPGASLDNEGMSPPRSSQLLRNRNPLSLTLNPQPQQAASRREKVIDKTKGTCLTGGPQPHPCPCSPAECQSQPLPRDVSDSLTHACPPGFVSALEAQGRRGSFCSLLRLRPPVMVSPERNHHLPVPRGWAYTPSQHTRSSA